MNTITSKRRLAVGLCALAAVASGGGAAVAAGGSADVSRAPAPRDAQGTVEPANRAGNTSARLVKRDPRRANGAVVAARDAGVVRGQVERAPSPGNDARPAPAP